MRVFRSSVFAARARRLELLAAQHSPSLIAMAAISCFVVFSTLALLGAAELPHISDDSAACEFKTVDGICYGTELRKTHFYLAENFTNLNHGSFGTVVRPVHAAQEEFFVMQESYPDRWFRKQYYDALEVSRQLISDFVGAQSSDVVLVENASSAVNSILRSLDLQKGDKVLRLSTAYGMVTNTLNYLSEIVGIEVLVANVTYPIADDTQIIGAVTDVLKRHPDVKLCVFSHISSLPAIVEPLTSLVEQVRSNTNDALILVDGAHAPGQIDLNIPSLDVDFYLGNCHKWLYAPKGTAFLWVDEKHTTATFPEPSVISSANAVGSDYDQRYKYTGTRDYTAFATLPAALEFRRYLGGEDQIKRYCHQLAVNAGKYLASAWGTTLLVPPQMTAFMVNIVLPSTDATAIKLMQEELNETYGIYIVYGSVEVTVKTDNHQDRKECINGGKATKKDTACQKRTVYVTRLSAQVYLDMNDFIELGRLVPELLRKEEIQKKTAVQ